MGQVCFDDMTVEILCTGLRDFRAKYVGAVSKKVFLKQQMHLDDMTVVSKNVSCKNRPHGGARRGPCEK